jgi:uncharacterized protein (TIGR00369 family)
LPQSSPEAPSARSSAPDSGALASAALDRSPLMEKMGITLLEASPDRVVATMPVEGNTQPLGLLHGGASCVLAETLGSVGASLHGALSGKFPVGVDINATHHRSGTAGKVTGTATALQLGGSIASYEIVIVDDAGRRICTARLTCLLRSIPTPTQ